MAIAEISTFVTISKENKQTRPKLKHEPCNPPQEQVVSFGAQKG